MATEYPANFFAEMAETGEFGPFMAALTVRQRSFVIAYCLVGDGNAKAAAKSAGFAAKSDVSLRVHAHATLHNPRVQSAMHEWGRSRLQARAPTYLKELDHLATSRTVKDDVRLKANLGALSRAGFGGEVNINQNHTVVISFDEKINELKRLAALAGDDPDKAIEGLVAPSDALPGSTEPEWEEIG